MAFKENFPIVSKILLENKILVQIETVKYLGCNISFAVNLDIEERVNKIKTMCRAIQRTFKNR